MYTFVYVSPPLCNNEWSNVTPVQWWCCNQYWLMLEYLLHIFVINCLRAVTWPPLALVIITRSPVLTMIIQHFNTSCHIIIISIHGFLSQYKCPTYLLSNVKKENIDIQCQSQQQGGVLGARCIFSEKLHFHNVRVCVLLLVVVTWSVFIFRKTTCGTR